MLCKRPFMAGTIPFGCGQCLPCRINRRRQWMWRQYLESLTHEENCFVTLTYSPDHMPTGGNLEPRVVQLWLKRIRKVIDPLRFRYFLVGEYGDQSLRPHYHLSVFGLSGSTVVRSGRHPTFERAVSDTWSRGFVQVAEFNELTAQYVAGYVTKKLTFAGDPRLGGRVPEFARMSRRPGLGTEAVKIIAKQLLSNGQSWESGDVPHELRIGKRRIPLGRFMLKLLRSEVGFTDEYSKEVRDRASMERSLELLALFTNSEGSLTITEAYKKEIAQKLLQVETRSKIFAKRGNL